MSISLLSFAISNSLLDYAYTSHDQSDVPVTRKMFKYTVERNDVRLLWMWQMWKVILTFAISRFPDSIRMLLVSLQIVSEFACNRKQVRYCRCKEHLADSYCVMGPSVLLIEIPTTSYHTLGFNTIFSSYANHFWVINSPTMAEMHYYLVVGAFQAGYVITIQLV